MNTVCAHTTRNKRMLDTKLSLLGELAIQSKCLSHSTFSHKLSTYVPQKQVENFQTTITHNSKPE